MLGHGARVQRVHSQRSRYAAQPALRRVRCRAALEVVTAVEGGELGWPTNFKERYKMGKIIGIGFFGRVYIGSDIATGEPVAIKIMPKQRGKLTRERTLEKLLLEVESLRTLQSSPSAVRLLGVFEDEAEVQMVTELCEGGDLEQLSEDVGNLPERAVALIAYEVLKMVDACHDAHILHGDIKPANFMMRTRKQNPLGSPNEPAYASIPWLAGIDFGCAQPVGDERLHLRAGTPTYMAPECVGRDYHIEADLWSVGTTLYQLVARRTPEWKAYEEARLTILENPEADAPLPLNSGPWIKMSPEGRDLIGAMLARDYPSRITAKEALQHPWFAKWVPNFKAQPVAARLAPAAASPATEVLPAAAPPAEVLPGAADGAAWPPRRAAAATPAPAAAQPRGSGLSGDGASGEPRRMATPPPPPRPNTVTPPPRPAPAPAGARAAPAAAPKAAPVDGSAGPSAPFQKKELPPHMREIDERAQILKPEPAAEGKAEGGRARWTLTRPAWWRFSMKKKDSSAEEDKDKVSGTSFRGSGDSK